LQADSQTLEQNSYSRWQYSKNWIILLILNGKEKEEKKLVENW
jgi:hypothetical protein